MLLSFAFAFLTLFDNEQALYFRIGRNQNGFGVIFQNCKNSKIVWISKLRVPGYPSHPHPPLLTLLRACVHRNSRTTRKVKIYCLATSQHSRGDWVLSGVLSAFGQLSRGMKLEAAKVKKKKGLLFSSVYYVQNARKKKGYQLLQTMQQESFFSLANEARRTEPVV